MSQIVLTVSFNLDFVNDWKKISANISDDLVGVDGFISRDSAVDDEGTIYCILKWESLKQQEAFMKSFEVREGASEMMAEFGRIVNMETMKREVYDVI